jgi:hypothetical protein
MDQSITGRQRLTWDEFGAHTQLFISDPVTDFVVQELLVYCGPQIADNSLRVSACAESASQPDLAYQPERLCSPRQLFASVARVYIIPMARGSTSDSHGQ